MLEKLYIKNYLIIKDAELNFTGGLNIITGETGAGKSIILDALGLLLGERGNYSIIKKDEDKLIVEGIFNFSGYRKAINFLKENSVINEENKEYVIIRRELSKKGISRTFINDTPVSINLLKEFGDIIVDIHSQNEHQSLLRKETHLEFLDNYTGDNKITEEYFEKYKTYKKLISEYEALLSKRNEIQERKAFYEFQLKEINKVNPQKNEDLELEQTLKMLENAEQINESLTKIRELLYDKDENINAGLLCIIKELRKISQYDSELERNLGTLEEAYQQIKTITEEIRNHNKKAEYDGETTEQIRQRLSSLAFLKKKYGLTVNQIIEKAEELEKHLNNAENFEAEIEKLEKEKQEKISELYILAEKLTSQRKKEAKSLEKHVNKYLLETGLEGATFKVNIEDFKENETTGFVFSYKDRKIKLTENGKDNTEFFIKINKGSDYTPLRKTASGGEISRIMLSLKASISGTESIPILIFDEIDAGISGKTADKVGNLIFRLAKERQIIAITHLPQIAAAGNNHLKVIKKETKTDTQVYVTASNNEEKIIEVANLFSGKKTTEASLIAAKELIEQYQKK